MATITATAYGHTFTRKTKIAWTHACITAYNNGYVHINWSKSEQEAIKLAAYKHAWKAETDADPEKASNPIVGVTVVPTTITA